MNSMTKASLLLILLLCVDLASSNHVNLKQKGKGYKPAICADYCDTIFSPDGTMARCEIPAAAISKITAKTDAMASFAIKKYNDFYASYPNEKRIGIAAKYIDPYNSAFCNHVYLWACGDKYGPKSIEACNWRFTKKGDIRLRYGYCPPSDKDKCCENFGNNLEWGKTPPLLDFCTQMKYIKSLYSFAFFKIIYTLTNQIDK